MCECMYICVCMCFWVCLCVWGMPALSVDCRYLHTTWKWQAFIHIVYYTTCVCVCLFWSLCLLHWLYSYICVSVDMYAKVVQVLTKRPSTTIKLDACECRISHFECRIKSGAARHMAHTKSTRKPTCAECHMCQGMLAATHSLRFYICWNFHHLFHIIILYLLFFFGCSHMMFSSFLAAMPLWGMLVFCF